MNIWAGLPAAMPSIRHVSFDKDGVLLDVHFYWASVIEERARHITEQISGDDGMLLDLALGMGVDPHRHVILPGGPVGFRPRAAVAEGAVSVLARHGHTGPNTEWVLARFAETDAETANRLDEWCRPVPGVKEVVEALARAGYTLSIVTSDRTELARRAMALFGISQHFRTVVGGDKMPRQKPDPSGIEMACAEVGVAAGETAYVGDTLGDMEAATAAGATPVGVLSGLGSAEELSDLAANVLPSVHALIAG